MCDKAVIIFLTLLISALASWVIWLSLRVMDLKEDVRVARSMLDYYKDKVIKYEAKMLGIKAELKDVG